MRRQITLIRATLVMLALVLAGSGLATPGLHAQSQVTSPEKFFGFQMGADRKMARWDKMVEYYQLLEKESGGKLKVVNMGPTDDGQPVPARHHHVAGEPGEARTPAPGEHPDQRPARHSPSRRSKKLVAEGKAVICQSMSLHATEIGGTQMAPELAYDLLARTDEETQRILDNVVFLMVPSFNPDGEIMVTDWYNKYLGTEYEGSNPPWLYHKYAGHDNNRDAFQTNLIESQYMAKISVQRLDVPQAYVDHHHMGTYGARIFLPPYAEPIRPLRRSAGLARDELVRRAHGVQGRGSRPVRRHQQRRSTPAGAISASTGSRRSTTSRACSPSRPARGWPRRSTSIPTSCRGGARNLPGLRSRRPTFPNPWPGGWWRLRDIVERQKVAAWAMLDLAARNRETVLWNAYLKAKRQTERGAAGKPRGVRDSVPCSTIRSPPIKLVNKLLVQGVEIKQAARGFTDAAGVSYPAGLVRACRWRSRRWASSATCSAARSTPTTTTRATGRHARSGPTTWPPTRCSSSWACASTRWTRP